MSRSWLRSRSSLRDLRIKLGGSELGGGLGHCPGWLGGGPDLSGLGHKPLGGGGHSLWLLRLLWGKLLNPLRGKLLRLDKLLGLLLAKCLGQLEVCLNRAGGLGLGHGLELLWLLPHDWDLLRLGLSLRQPLAIELLLGVEDELLLLLLRLSLSLLLGGNGHCASGQCDLATTTGPVATGRKIGKSAKKSMKRWYPLKKSLTFDNLLSQR